MNSKGALKTNDNESIAASSKKFINKQRKPYVIGPNYTGPNSYKKGLQSI